MGELERRTGERHPIQILKFEIQPLHKTGEEGWNDGKSKQASDWIILILYTVSLILPRACGLYTKDRTSL